MFRPLEFTNAASVNSGCNVDRIQCRRSSWVGRRPPPQFSSRFRLGAVRSSEGTAFEIDATLENSPAVLFDAMVLAGGSKAAGALSADGRTVEFIKDQYRHCKPILALGDSSTLLEKAGISPTLPSGEPDPGLLLETESKDAVDPQAFIAAIAKHRVVERDQDPPLV